MLHWVVRCFINFNPCFEFSSRMGLLYLWAGGNLFSLPWKHGDDSSIVYQQERKNGRETDDRRRKKIIIKGLSVSKEPSSPSGA